MKINTYQRIGSFILALGLFMAILNGCKRNDPVLDSLPSSSTSGDDFEVSIPSVTEVTGTGTSASNGTSSKTKATVYVPPGEEPVADPNEIRLPKLDIKKKSVRLLTRNAAPSEKFQNLLKEKYGVIVSAQTVPADQISQVLINMIQAGNQPDLFVHKFDPSFVSRNFIQPVGSDMIDFNSALWKGVKQNHKPYMINGKNYYFITRFTRQTMVWYNKKMFVTAGLQTPLQLYNSGKWDWNSFKNAAQKLTYDPDKTGTPQIYGWGYDEEMLLYTTGKHVVSYNGGNRPINNIKSPEVARYMAWLNEMSTIPRLGGGNARTGIAQGKVAMVPGQLWFATGYAEQIKNGIIEFAPMPKDPSANQHYSAEVTQGTYIVNGAKNIAGAAAFLSVERYMVAHPDYFKDYFNEVKERFGFTDEMRDVYITINTTGGGVAENWSSFNLGTLWGDIFHWHIQEKKPWSVAAEEIAPKVDHLIDIFWEQ